jgi:hypothetical protein
MVAPKPHLSVVITVFVGPEREVLNYPTDDEITRQSFLSEYQRVPGVLDSESPHDGDHCKGANVVVKQGVATACPHVCLAATLQVR